MKPGCRNILFKSVKFNKLKKKLKDSIYKIQILGNILLQNHLFMFQNIMISPQKSSKYNYTNINH